MSKKNRTTSKTKKKIVKCVKISPVHDFDADEVRSFPDTLVSWYEENKRDLPWRKLATDPDVNKRAYSVWVSEVMLQQTQVATVIDYYNKWMKKWPTSQDLAKSTLEKVNEMWSGLGYYSRGRRLYEGAQKVVNELNGEMPRDAVSLLRELPGVGRYTAGAIASIAYNEQTGLVDGNVIRVLSRLRIIGADSSSPTTMDVFWNHVNKLVPSVNPGDFNQALMELGATVCTPKTPNCSGCPVRAYCKARAQVEAIKIENASKLLTNDNLCNLTEIECLVKDCNLCLEKSEKWDNSLGVCNYPRKGKKKAAREERVAVCIVSRFNDATPQYLISQRPEKGLLGGLWEFPSQLISDNCVNISEYLHTKYGIDISNDCRRSNIGEVVHVLSHIHQTYQVEAVELKEALKVENKDIRWVTKDEFMESAVSTAMKKILKYYETERDESLNKGIKRKWNKSEKKHETIKQTSITTFFSTT